MKCQLLYYFLPAILLIQLLSLSSFAQQRLSKQSNSAFSQANIRMDRYGKTPLEIRFQEGNQTTVESFFKEYKTAFNLSDDNSFKLFKVFTDQLGQTHYRFKQYYKDIEIADLQFLLHEEEGFIFYAHGELIHGLNLDVLPILSEEEAIKHAIDHIKAGSYMWENKQSEALIKKEKNYQRAMFYPTAEMKISAGMKQRIAENFRLVYRVDISSKEPLGRFDVDVDAKTGEVIAVIPRFYLGDVQGQGMSLYNGLVPIIVSDSTDGNYRLRDYSRGGGIITYDALYKTDRDSAVDFIDNDSIFTDENAHAGVSVHWATQKTYDYYLEKHGRDSYDDLGGTLRSYVHFGYEFSNAGYFGKGRMVYGDGRGNVKPWVSIDWVGHEITHGVTSESAALGVSSESSALNESFSDIFATAIEFYVEGEAADWLIGEDNFPNCVRSLINPKAKDHPDTYLGEYWSDYAHGNGGVQNHWFYLLSEGGSGVNDNAHVYSVTGIGIEQAAQIAYRSMSVYLIPNSNFHDARLGSINAAIDLFGRDSHQYQAVLDAWDAVGVNRPFVGPYAAYATINSAYQVPGIDTLILRTKLVNPENQTIDVNAIVESSDQTIIDTISMFDDGLHQDRRSGDGLFGTYWPIPYGEKYYRMHIITTSLESGFHNVLRNSKLFTTTGPVVLDSYTISSRLGVLMLKLFLRNDGMDSVVTDISIDLTTTNSLVKEITASTPPELDIAAGQTVELDQSFFIHTWDSPDTIEFDIHIYSNDYHYWDDSFVIDFMTNLPKLDQSIPRDFALAQNYPNPFNPVTVISWQLAVGSNVDLSIYNVLGQKVTTLVAGKQKAGFYSVEWDAGGLASGVYYYRLQAGEFVDTKKLVLLR